MNNIIYAMIISVMVSLSPFSVNAAEEVASSTNETRSNIAKIIYSGLGGAIIGLSTLSFYGVPQEHMSNIALGFAAGILGGAIYVTYDTVAFYNAEEPLLLALDRKQKGKNSGLSPQMLLTINF